MERNVESNVELVSFCGLYCGACNKYKNGKCPACHQNEKASWCSVRNCCLQNAYNSCADCKEFLNPMDCGKYNNFMSKLFGLIFKSDRNAGINLIREKGIENFALFMHQKQWQSIKKGMKI